DLATLYRSQQFAVMLPSTNLRNALVPALRLRQLVADCQKPLYHGQPVEFTISVGVGQLRPEEQPGPLMQRAVKLANEAQDRGHGVAADPLTADEVNEIALEFNVARP
ncbi:MAG: diguanylate cyclase, partial [Planctomycetota bacterium]